MLDYEDQELVDKFNQKVLKGNEKECWLWVGGRNSSNPNRTHGVIRRDGTGKAIKAHRLSWAIAHNKNPTKLLVVQTCNNKLCVNPAHLSTTTIPPRGSAKGSKNGSAKLNETQAMEIFLAKGLLKQIAFIYDITPSTVYNIKKKKLWKHIHTKG